MPNNFPDRSFIRKKAKEEIIDFLHGLIYEYSDDAVDAFKRAYHFDEYREFKRDDSTVEPAQTNS